MNILKYFFITFCLLLQLQSSAAYSCTVTALGTTVTLPTNREAESVLQAIDLSVAATESMSMISENSAYGASGFVALANVNLAIASLANAEPAKAKEATQHAIATTIAAVIALSATPAAALAVPAAAATIGAAVGASSALAIGAIAAGVAFGTAVAISYGSEYAGNALSAGIIGLSNNTNSSEAK